MFFFINVNKSLKWNKIKRTYMTEITVKPRIL